MKLRFVIKSDTLICIWILVFPIGIIEFTTPRKWSFWHFIGTLNDYWPPSAWNVLVDNSWGEKEGFEKRAFQLLKMRKKKISWNIKTKCVTEFLLQLCLRVCRIIFVITRWAHKSQTLTLISIKIMRIWKFFVYT